MYTAQDMKMTVNSISDQHKAVRTRDQISKVVMPGAKESRDAQISLLQDNHQRRDRQVATLRGEVDR